MNKSKAAMSKETERTLKDMQDSDLKRLLDEVSSYKQIGDMRGKSPLVQGLLKQAEESESGEESIKRPPKRHKKPKERRRRKESDSLAARTHAGGSLDNIGGEKAQTAARHRGVAGRTREGGSCCNLSRGSFETTVARRRRRRDPHRQHGGSLEDLSAIDETAAGAGRAKSSVSESGKHGGSLQNINQEGGGDFRPATAAAAAAAAAVPAASPAATASAAAASAAAAIAAAPGPPSTVIDIDDEGPAAASAASRASPRGGRSESTEHDRPSASGEVRADAVVDFPLRLDPRHQQQPPSQQQQREPPRQSPYTAPSGSLSLDSVSRNVGQLLSTRSAGYTRDEVHDMPPGELLNPSHRRAQSAAEGGGCGGGVLIGQRPNSSNSLGSSRGRKTKKKEEQEQKTEHVDGYRGEGDLETILGFIESGDKKDKNGNKKSDKAKDGKKDTKNRKNGVRAGEEERSGGRSERSGGRGTERRPSGRSAAKAAPAGRSSSLEARPGPTAAAAGTAAAAASAAGHTDATSVFCGDLAKSSLKKSDSTPAGCRSKAGPSVVAFDGGTYVSPAAAERESEGFVQDFYSVTTDSTAIEETEFHVVTRKQRKRGSGARAGTAEVTRPHALRHKTSSLDEGGRARHESLGQPRRPYVPGLRHTTSSSAPHSELSDSDSDGAGSLPPPPPPSLVDQGGCRMVRASPPPSSAANHAPAPATATTTTTGGSGGGVSSWADVTRNRQENHTTTPTPIPATPTPTPVTPTPNPTAPASRASQPVAGTRDAETSTDFIDGVGPIFGERSSPKGRPVAAVAAFVRGASEPADCLIGGSHPDEFPEIASTPVAAAAATAAAKSPRSGPAAPAAATPSGGSAAPPVISSTTVVSSGAQTDTRQTAGSAGPVPAPAGPVPAPASAPASPAVPASRAPAPAPTAAAAAAAAASPDTNSAMSGSAPSPAARPASDANSTSDRRSAAPAPAPAPVARRTKKAPAVTIRGTLEDAVSPGASSAHVQGIQFGYIEPVDEPERSAGEPRPSTGAVELFCRRFRSPSVDVTRFNWSEISVYLNKVYDEAARDPSAFFVANDTPNGLRRPVPVPAAAAARPAL